MDPVDDGLDLAADHGERSPQLVAEIGEQPAPPLVLGLEAPCHAVEGTGHRGPGPSSPLRYPDAGVALTKLGGGIDELRYRSPGAAERPTHEQREADDDEEADEEEPGPPRRQHPGDEPAHDGAHHEQEEEESEDPEADVASRATTLPRRALPSAMVPFTPHR